MIIDLPKETTITSAWLLITATQNATKIHRLRISSTFSHTISTAGTGAGIVNPLVQAILSYAGNLLLFKVSAGIKASGTCNLRRWV
jgi:hypothetical protein